MTNEDILEYAEKLKAYSFYLERNKERAENLLHDTFLLAFTSKDKFKDGTNLKAWLFKIMKNRFYSSKSSNSYKRTIYTDDILDATLYPYYTSNKVFEAMNVELLSNVISTLDQNLQDIFRLYTRGFKYKEIAERFDMPIGTVKFRLNRIKKELRTKLENIGYERH